VRARRSSTSRSLARAVLTHLTGRSLGEFNFETWNALGATITVHGVDIHPGTAKDKMVNSTVVAGRIMAALPSDRLTPDTTDGRNGFIHVVSVEGNVSTTVVEVILRDFDDDLLQSHLALLQETVDTVMATEPKARVEMDVREQYPNMRKYLDNCPGVRAAAERAIEAEGIELVVTPVRGGTDGSRLSAMGLPTPNLFTGGYEYHSVREWASLQDMSAAAATIVHLAKVWATDEDLWAK